jgi:hypothetical protein
LIEYCPLKIILPKNLIFTTWQYNCDKGVLSPKGARFFLKIAEERYGKKVYDLE